MKLTSETTLAEFRDYFQMIVNKYHPRARIVRDALRFARGHSDPAFYRMASEKAHAQEQWWRETYGPSWSERLSVLFNATSVREVAFTLAMVAVAVFGIDAVRNTWGHKGRAAASEVDVDQIARRMGFYVNDSVKSPTIDRLEETVTQKLNSGLSQASIDQLLDARVTTAIEKLNLKDVAAKNVNSAVQATSVSQLVAQQVSDALKAPEIQKIIAERVREQLATVDIKGPLSAQIQSALAESKVSETLAKQVADNLQKFEQQVGERGKKAQDEISASIQEAIKTTKVSEQVSGQITTAINEAIKNAKIEQRVAEQITAALAKQSIAPAAVPAGTPEAPKPGPAPTAAVEVTSPATPASGPPKS